MASPLFSRIETCSTQAPWIVFGNSLMTDLSIWDEQVAALSGRYNILRYDQRGHGRSPVGEPGFSFEELGSDLLGLLDEAGIATCCYVGLSMGVPTGLAAYKLQPDRFSAMILVDGQAASTATSEQFWSERIASAQGQGMQAIALQTVGRWLRPGRHGSARAEALQAMIAATPLQGFINCAALLKSYDQSEAFDSIAVPLALIAGAEDGVLPQTMQMLALRKAGALYQSIADAGHVPNFERPEAFNTVLDHMLADFFGEVVP